MVLPEPVDVQMAAPARDVVPAGQGVQLAAAFTSEKDPAGQTEQVVAPAVLEKVPFWHSLQDMASGRAKRPG